MATGRSNAPVQEALTLNAPFGDGGLFAPQTLSTRLDMTATSLMFFCTDIKVNCKVRNVHKWVAFVTASNGHKRVAFCSGRTAPAQMTNLVQPVTHVPEGSR